MTGGSIENFYEGLEARIGASQTLLRPSTLALSLPLVARWHCEAECEWMRFSLTVMCGCDFGRNNSPKVAVHNGPNGCASAPTAALAGSVP